MLRAWSVVASGALVVSGLTASACSSSNPSAAPPATTDGPVSFSNDVLPIFQQNCNLGACHGQVGNAEAVNLYLGDPSGSSPSMISQVYAGLVGVKSYENPSMNLVTKGDTASSFLSYKIQDTQDKLAAGCAMAPVRCLDCTANRPCGSPMLYLGTVFSTSHPTEFATIEKWIADGAMNN